MDPAVLSKDVLESKAKLRELEIKLGAVIGILEKEGILTKDEVMEDFKAIFNNKNKQ